MRGSPLILAVSTLLGAPSAAAAADPAVVVAVRTPVPTCQRADALLDLGYVDDAERAFKDLLGSEACARVGIGDIAAIRRGAVAAATAPEALKREQEVIRRLEGNGFETEARKRVQKYVEANDEALPADLRALDQRIPESRKLMGTIVPIARTVAEAVIIILAVLVVFFVGVRLLLVLFARIFKGLRLTGFAGSDEAGLSEGLTGALHDALAGLGDNTPRRHLEWVSATEGEFKVPTALAAKAPEVALIGELLSTLDRAFPRNMFLISGTVRPVDPVRGAGLTLTLAKRNGGVHSQQTVWEKDFDLPVEGEEHLPARYAQLVVAGAVWLAFDPKGKKVGGESEPLGCSDWRSYAHLAVGELHQRAGDLGEARKAYEAALDRDAGNFGAKLNLASLMLHRPSEEIEPDGGRRRLATAGALLDDVLASAEDPRTTMWYRARYVSASHWLYTADLPDHGAAAAQRAQDLLTELDTKLEERTSSKLGAFIRTFRDPAGVMLQTARLRANASGAAAPDLGKVDRSGWRAPDALYNAACFYSRRFERKPADADPSDKTTALDRLESWLGRAPSDEDRELWCVWVRTDPDFWPLRNDDRFKLLTAKKPEPAEKPVEERIGEAVGERVTAVLEGLASEDAVVSL